MTLYCLFVLAVTGAVAPQALAQTGTALSPLAQTVGPSVHVLGSAFAVLGLGRTSITISLVLYSLALERLPSAAPIVIALPRRAALLLFEPRRPTRGANGRRVGLVYLGLDGGEPRFRLDTADGNRLQRVEATATDVHEHGDLFDIDLSDADERTVRLRVTSRARLTYEGAWDALGLSLAEVVALSDPESGSRAGSRGAG